MKSGLLLVAVSILLAGAPGVQACVCRDGDNSTLGRFESARFVVVNKIISVQKESRVRTVYSGGQETQEPFTAIVSIRTIVERVYKGDMEVGEEMIFGQGGKDCLVEFREEEIGTKFLFYLDRNDKKSKLWYAGMCDRAKPLPNYKTRYIEDAGDDLLYLDKMNEVRGKTRISGTLISYQWSITGGNADFKRLAGQKVQIVGDGRIYEAVTNEYGAYEIYDLPPGSYAIRPQVRQGWAIDEHSAFGGNSSGTTEDDGSSQVPLKAGRHGYADFIFKVNNRLSGKIVDASGRPLQLVCIRLLPTQSKTSEEFKRDDCTDDDGRFEIDEIPFGKYVVVVNADDKISSRQPFRKFYYPAEADREKAQVITIVEGETEYPLDIRVPGTKEIVTVTGKVLSADGKSVVLAFVGFTSDQTDPTIDGSAFARTDQQGNFSLNVLKGVSGTLSAAVMLDPKEFKSCPALLRVAGTITLDRTTEDFRVQADRHTDGIELRFDFPSCKEGKITSQIRID